MPKAYPIWTKEWISTATLNVANGSHGNTLTEVDSPLNFHRQRNIKFSVRRHILYNKINLLGVPKVRPLRSKFQKSPCRKHENSIVGMYPMATHCQKLIVTGIYQANSYQKFVMSYWLAFVPKSLNMLSILKCNNLLWQSDFFGPFRQTNFLRLMELSHLILKYEEKSLV